MALLELCNFSQLCFQDSLFPIWLPVEQKIVLFALITKECFRLTNHPRQQSSAELREQILDLSKRYVRALAEENKNIMNGGNGVAMSGYADLKRTIAVLLDDILQRLVKLENKVDYMVVNGSTTNTTNGNLMPATTSKRVNAANSIR
ncbi:coiled-coil domain-containing protein 126 isoform X3 [Rhineura floridana]|uniref:coiled-coil domain-containing protein 126 isoform X3 n=1 Tax=Rhineura floridana TaxID=261503 RepID=UPI002AC7FA3D|nr:coiled-coil domain-containing protein 126 isoform X3 [Rhineura floridana]